MKVTAQEVRKALRHLLTRIEAGEEVVITRNGKEVTRLVATSNTKVLPDLAEFRASVKLGGEPMSETVVRMRQDNCY